MEVTLIRHAQTSANAAGVLQGQGQSNLTDLGEEQAQAAAARFDVAEYDLLEASDLERAMETAAVFGSDFAPSVEWRELDIGAWEGKTWSEVQKEYADDLERMRAGGEVRFGGGESLQEFSVRVRQSFDRLTARLVPTDRALVVTHGGVVNELVKYVSGLDVRSRRFGRSANTSFTRLIRSDGRWSLSLFNDSTHLGEDSAYLQERLESGKRLAYLIADGDTEPNPEPGGETWAAAGSRLEEEIDRALSKTENNRLTFVTENATIGAYLGRVLELSHRERHRLDAVDPASVSTVVFEEHGPVIADFNIPES